MVNVDINYRLARSYGLHSCSYMIYIYIDALYAYVTNVITGGDCTKALRNGVLRFTLTLRFLSKTSINVVIQSIVHSKREQKDGYTYQIARIYILAD